MIWQDINLEWKGEAYTVRPTLALIAAIESHKGCSLRSLIVRTAADDLPSAATCQVIATTLQAAGAKVTPEEIFAETHGGINQWSIDTLLSIVAACNGAGFEKKKA
jgi:hypothetical protein